MYTVLYIKYLNKAGKIEILNILFFFPAWSSTSSMYFTAMAHLVRLATCQVLRWPVDHTSLEIAKNSEVIHSDFWGPF